MDKNKLKEKTFVSFRENGIHLNFPNGVGLSVIWGYGSYSENHDWEHPDNKGKRVGDDGYHVHKLFEKITEGSNSVEVMIIKGASNQFITRLSKNTSGEGQNPWGYIGIGDWLKIINRCYKYKPIKKCKKHSTTKT